MLYGRSAILHIFSYIKCALLLGSCALAMLNSVFQGFIRQNQHLEMCLEDIRKQEQLLIASYLLPALLLNNKICLVWDSCEFPPNVRYF